MERKHHFADEYVANPYMNSYDTTPETDRQQQHSSLSEPISLCHSPSSSDCSSSFKTNEEGDSGKGLNTKFGKKSSSFAYRIREHVKLGPKLSETVKGKLSLGARIIQKGGRRNIFKQIFGVNEGEELLKASQCYLSTTAGPIPGLLFISTQKLAFCSERSISVPCAATATATGQVVRTPYKVQIPIRKIKRANQTENVNKPQQKYIEIVTEDDFEFWFMGFLRYEKAFRNLEKAISITNQN
ncbi:putative GEM-like protein 8 [Prunus yedoensis var. nudiflora]|uniref:Putative GEM-like protein 8 n=1 Tax=Prunus yedoensis var. nudiflora TaxID=2094558 RepID=A0A314ZJD2_PRUYE|nr:putative GEM-like protein 8 [Prunus yedoensis var. nudiflora]